MTIDLSGLHFNSRLLALELQRRKIEVSLVPGTTVLRAKKGKRIEYVDDTDLSVMPATLRFILDDKWKTKMILKQEGFSVIDGRAFTPDRIEEAIVEAHTLGWPVVLKPAQSTHGVLVAMNIESEEECRHEFETLAQRSHFSSAILVEKQIAGHEFRLTVTKNGFFAAVFRSPPSVVGDGKKTIRSLIDAINREREPRGNCLCPIWVNSETERYLKKKGLSLSSVPKKGDTVYVRSNSNVTTGGGCIDVTEKVHPFFRDLAFKILASIEGLPYVGIDLLTSDITKKNTYHICELNPSPGISLHTHPELGTPRELPKALIELIFPL